MLQSANVKAADTLRYKFLRAAPEDFAAATAARSRRWPNCHALQQSDVHRSGGSTGPQPLSSSRPEDVSAMVTALIFQERSEAILRSAWRLRSVAFAIPGRSMLGKSGPWSESFLWTDARRSGLDRASCTWRGHARVERESFSARAYELSPTSARCQSSLQNQAKSGHREMR